MLYIISGIGISPFTDYLSLKMLNNLFLILINKYLLINVN